MALFDENITKQLREILALMKDDVNLVFFSQEIECTECKENGMFLQEIVSLGDKLKMSRYKLEIDKEQVDKYGIDKIPAIVLLDKDGMDTGIRFYGTPGGYEINSFLGALLEISGLREELPKELLDRIRAISQDTHIQVFVTLNCPYCPNQVLTAHRLALENKKIRADMVELGTFPYLAVKYNVSAVPKTVINEQTELIGVQPLPALIEAIEKIEPKTVA
jgi:glutaredoxin-like protein